MEKKRDLRYRKIKIDDKGRVYLEYDWPVEDGGYDTVKWRYKDQPLPKFQQALDDMAVHLVEICELPKEYAENMTVMGVSLSYTDANVMGLTIIAKKALSNKLVVPFNSPHLPEQAHSDRADEFPILTALCIADLKQVIGQAEGYRLGDRAQGDIFAGDETATPKAKGKAA